MTTCDTADHGREGAAAPRESSVVTGPSAEQQLSDNYVISLHPAEETDTNHKDQIDVTIGNRTGQRRAVGANCLIDTSILLVISYKLIYLDSFTSQSSSGRA